MNENLTKKLLALTADVQQSAEALQAANAVVSHIEVNAHHGVGVLLQRLFEHQQNVLSIRSKDFYQGHQTFGAFQVCISHGSASRDMVYWKILKGLAGTTVKQILCVPYFADDALTAIGLAELFGAPLCTFLMDDQNLYADGIPDSIMRELLAKSALRLAISPELRTGYEEKYQQKLWFMPPLVSAHFILSSLNQVAESDLQAKTGAIVGNIWGQRWLELLRDTVRGSGVTLRWYNNGQFRWLPCSTKDLPADGIEPQEGTPHPDHKLIEILRRVPFVVIPSGVLDDTDDRRFIAKLSFPSRIPYILATSQAPMLVLGSRETAAARFVTGAGVGLVAPYERRAFQDAVARITHPELNLEMRRRALLLAARFSDIGAAEWIWQSLAKGAPVDSRYENLIPDNWS